MSAEPLDEMVDGQGGFRPHWRPLLGALAQLGPETLAERAQLLEEALAEDAGPGARPAATPRRCDLIPLILPPAEFTLLEAGLAQRAAAIEALLQDVYGPQHLLAEGLLPPALAFANPAFLRPCRSAVPRPPLLQSYAADLLRGADGAWRVVADRTACPAGLARALENRDLLARLVPEFFRARPLRPLRPFLDLWQDALARLAPEGSAVALLSPGPRGADWFEQVLLARHLSCALVEGGDLTVRDGALYLKTLRGLSRIGVLLRRQDGRTIDPLELDPDPMGGVVGLLDAARAGTVRIVNDPGAGFAEAPAVAAFLPALAPRLTGEALRLPQAETLWLGDAAVQARVGEDLRPWLVRRALDGTLPSVRAGQLAPEARAALAARLMAAPADWAVSAALAPSVAPCAGPDGRLGPRPIMLRVFLVHDGSAWRALPGGLARTLPEPGAEPGAGAAPLGKDVWVPAEDPEEGRPLIALGALPAMAPLPIRRASGDLPSRVADDFYWLGRYLERLEASARLLRSAAARLARPSPTAREMAELDTLARCLVRADLLSAEAGQGLGAAAMTEALLRAAGEGGPLAGQFAQVGRLAGVLRDRLTGEMQAAIAASVRSLGERLRGTGPGPAAAGAGVGRLAAAADGILGFAATVAGLAAENMVRGGGRLFLDFGRRMERAQAIAAWVACALDQPGALAQPARIEPGLRLALELCDSVITYRSRYLSQVQPAPVLDLVLADAGNPRGLAFQLAAARDMLAELEAAEGGPSAGLAGVAERLGEEVQAMVDAVAHAPAQAEAALALPPRLAALEGAVAALSDRVSGRFFALLPVAHSLGLESAAAGEAGPARPGVA